MARLFATCVLLTLLLAMTASSSARADDPSDAAGIRQLRGYGRGRKVGARTEVRDVEGDREVQELGRFSVAEHNRRRECCGDGSGGRLEFSRVVAAQRQVVSGLKYYLTVAAVEEDEEEERVFDAVVVVKPWLQSRTLLKFAPASAKY
ncbi:hypothetical protein QOZ80_1AG0044240 [Eleusine coracana subsp. coracana]|nr:hypothetical protein QOZ80_1AG0044240 [Eleusine coracana subsp. coracana]